MHLETFESWAYTVVSKLCTIGESIYKPEQAVMEKRKERLYRAYMIHLHHSNLSMDINVNVNKFTVKEKMYSLEMTYIC